MYVGLRRHDYTFRTVDTARLTELATRVDHLGLVRPEVEQAERPLRVQADRERLAMLQRHLPGGRLLDVGCSTGAFLDVATGPFEASGIEPDVGTSEQARIAGHDVTTRSLEEVEPSDGVFDAITMFHVIEHLDSPRRAIAHARELLRPGGILMIETPTTDSLLFRLAPHRWRQLIPDHYFFFSRATLEALIERCGMEPLHYAKVGRRVTLRFVADRMRRSGLPLSGPIAYLVRAVGVEDRTVRLNPGDIMSVVARRVG
jgi:SAM-dependent methyltransferase